MSFNRSGYIGRAPGDSAITIAKQYYQPTGVQTDFTFSSGYSPGLVDVYRNGVKLINVLDYAATDGSTISLDSPVGVGSTVQVVAYKAFNLATVKATELDTTVTGTDLTLGGDLTVSDLITTVDINVSGSATVSGTVVAGSFSGDGSALTGLATTEYVVSVATTTGNLNVSAAATITGDLTVSDSIAITKDINVGAAATITGALSGSTGTFSGAVNIDATTDSTSSTSGALIVDGGLGVAKNVYIGAGLSVAGTLTYEDVTNVDSVGVVTAKSGVNITGGELTVGSGITMGIAGVATFSGTADVHLLDNVKLNVGDGSDLSLYHASGWNYIQGSASGVNLAIQSKSGENNLVGIPDGKTSLYYNGNEKFQTTNDGTVTTGIATATGGLAINADSKNLTIGAGEDLKLYHNGSHSYTDNGTGSLFVRSDNQIYFQATNGDRYADFVDGGAVKLYYSNAAENKKFETTNDGTVTTGIATATLGAVVSGGTLTIPTVAGTNNNASQAVLFQTSAGVVDGGSGLTYNPANDTLTINGADISAQMFRGNAGSVTLANDTYSSTESVVVTNKVVLNQGGSAKLSTTNEGIEVTGFTSTTAGMGVTGGLFEGSFIKAGKLSDNQTLGISTANFFYFTTQETTTATPNIVWNDSYSLSSKMAVGDVASVTVVTTAAAGGYAANWTIDGNAVTEEWVGGSAPSAGGSDGLDIYSLTIIKTGTGTGDSGFKVIANVSNAT